VPTALERFRHHWSSIPAGQRGSFSAVSCLCADEDGQIIGSRFPRDPLDSDPREVRWVHKVTGEKWGFHRTDVLREFPFPVGAWPFMAESLIWNRIGRRYRTRYVNEPLRIYHRDEGAPHMMSDLRDASRHAAMYMRVEREQLNEDLRYALRAPIVFAKGIANYVRFSLHEGIGPLGQLRGLRAAAWPLWAVGLPVGGALYARDRRRAAARRRA
jgi:hypothetical protein